MHISITYDHTANKKAEAPMLKITLSLPPPQKAVEMNNNRKGYEKEYIYVYVTESLCCMAEINMAL